MGSYRTVFSILGISAYSTSKNGIFVRGNLFADAYLFLQIIIGA